MAVEHARRNRSPSRWLALLLFACVPVLLDASPAAVRPAGTRAPGEVEVEAAYLVNFLRYTQWPAAKFQGPGSPYVVTVVGSRAAADSVRAVCSVASGIEGRGIEVRWLPLARGSREAPFDTLQDEEARSLLRDSHLVFFHRSSGRVHPQVFDDLAGLPVLTVSDIDDFTQQGGMLGLVRSDRRIVFQANTGAIRSAGLLVSAKVLKLARTDARAVP